MSCKKCIGGSDMQCIECADIAKFLFSGKCEASCPSHYFGSSGVCLRIFRKTLLLKNRMP